jgi:hypothetical protein
MGAPTGLIFNNLSWPHVSVATLVPADPVNIPDFAIRLPHAPSFFGARVQASARVRAAPRNQMSRSSQERHNRNESLGFKTLCWRWTGMSLRTLAGLSDDPRGRVAYVIRAGALDSVLHHGPTLADPSFVLFNPPADLMSCLTRGSETRDWVHSTCSEISRGLEPWSENQQTDSCTTSILSL